MRQHQIVVIAAVFMLVCLSADPVSAQDECAQIVEVDWHPTYDLFALSCDTIIYIYTSEFELVTTIVAPPEPPDTFPRATSLEWSPDGRYLAAAILRADAPGGDGSESRLVVWEIEHASVILDVPNRGSPIAWSPDSTMIASDSGSRSNGVYFYEVATGREVARCIPCGVREYMAWNPVDMHQFLASSTLSPVFFDPMSPELPPEVLPEVPPTYIVLSNSHHPDGSRFAAYNHDEDQIEVRDTYTRDILATLAFDETGWINSYHWLADGIYIEMPTYEVLRWDGVSKHAEILFSTDEWRPYYWKPDGSLFVSVNQTGVFVYETLTGDLKAELLYEATATPTPQPVSTQDECHPRVEIAWHPTDDLFAFNCVPTVYIYTSEIELITTLAAPPEPPDTIPAHTSLAWSPDGRYLASGILRYVGEGTESRLVVWEIETASVILDLPNRGSPIAWSPDSTMIATDSFFHADGVYFYEVATGREVAHCIRCGGGEYIMWNPSDMHQFLIGSFFITVFFDPLSPELPPEGFEDFSVTSDGYRSDGTRFIAHNYKERQLEVRDAYTRDVLATLSFDENRSISSYHWLADGIYIETINHQVLRWDGVSKHAEILFSTEWRDHYWKPDGSLFVSPNYQNATFVGAFVYETHTGDLKAQLLYEATATSTPQP